LLSSSAVPPDPAYEFDVDTAVSPDKDLAGHWQGAFTDRWHIGDKPNGGYILATAARAMSAAVPSHPLPLTTTAHYLRPGEVGPVSVETDVVRVGRTLATVRATLSQFGKERIVVLATFGKTIDTTRPSVVAGAPPDIPDIADCIRRSPDMSSVPMLASIANRTDTFLHPNTGFVTGSPSGVADVSAWTRFADGREADALSLLFFADSLPPAVFEVLPSPGWVPTIELTVHVRGTPTPGWLRVRMRSRFVFGGYLEEEGEIWDSSGQLVAQSRQLGMLLPG
jgi:acyl-CoA thioesterase